MKNFEKTAELIIEQLGGIGNISTLTHCMTRLRFGLVSDEHVDDDAIKNIPNVIGVVRKGGQYQIIIGNDVSDCFKAIQKQTGSKDKELDPEKKKFTLKGWGASILDAISGSIAPLIPVILGCGMVKILIIILDMLEISKNLPTYKILSIIGDAGYYFLPLLLAFSASKKFKCNTPLAMTIVAVLVHPDLIAILYEGNSSFLSVPVTSASYSSSVIPALLSVWFLSKLEPLTDRVFTGWRRTLLKPLAILLICTPIVLIALAPLGMLIGNGMAAILNFMYTKVGWLTISVYSALLPFVVMAGMHVAVFPYIFSNLDTMGFDFLQLPAMLAYNFSQAAAAAAVAIKSKDKVMKATATAAAISACVGGITEPALYGVNLRLKKPLLASMIGSGSAGLLIGFLGVKAFAFSGPCLLSLPMFASSQFANNFVYACLAAVVSVVVTFVLTLLFSWDETTDASSQTMQKELVLAAPLAGTIIPLSQVKDETFAKEMMGKGAAILPDENYVVAPFNGKVSALFPTKHAIGIEDDCGTLQVLIHIGIDTVELNGSGFESSLCVGDTFHKGDILMKFDKERIQKEGYDITTPVIITNAASFQDVKLDETAAVKHLQTLLHIYK